ncbi:Polysaccharide pyruvyl transferase family protein WcaK [Planococcus glaciei]|uniref:polysaccharide pyruvyl transferase family protein n=1 Tax=Planococcus glaciei TaxID=459472 RepID=UPI00087F127A|nr:polysaccharide pyruvyl transferase family protein [Planococcus glaciei]SDH86922.1 Polysaccharide pyruvyl transferase family protein WcaK [Planococcus glaciei]
MMNAVVFSFFKSSNLGDLALSEAATKLFINKNYDIIKFDFPTTSRVYENVRSIQIPLISNENINKETLLKSFIKRKIKRIVLKLVKRDTIEKIYLLYLLKTSNKWKELESSIKNVDKVIFAGGNMIMDLNSTKGYEIIDWPFLFKSYCALAKKHQKEINVLYIGVGPINNDQSFATYKKAFELVDKLSVRDNLSYQISENLYFNSKTVQTVDPVFSLNSDFIVQRRKAMRQLKETLDINIGICVLGQHCFKSNTLHLKYLEMLVKLSLNLKEKNNEIKFYIFSTEVSDFEAVKLFQQMLIKEANIKSEIKKVETVEDVFKFYNSLQFLIGGRMHSLIFAQKALLPFIGFIWQEKLIGFGKVVNSDEKLFNIEFAFNNIEQLSEIINQDMKNELLLKKMSETNNILFEMVEKGNVKSGILNNGSSK